MTSETSSFGKLVAAIPQLRRGDIEVPPKFDTNGPRFKVSAKIPNRYSEIGKRRAPSGKSLETKFRKKRAGLAALLVCTACVPLPHHEQTHPRLEGKLSLAGKALVGKKVALYSGRSSEAEAARCEDFKNSEVTGEDGLFSFDAESEFYFFLWFGDKRDSWTLCFDLDGSVYRWQGSGWLGGPKQQELDCDIVRAAKSEDICKSL